MDSPRRLAKKQSQPNIRLRGLLTSGGKDKVSPELREALSLLHIRDLAGLENHFLALESFLKPWCHYRDTYLLVRSQIATASASTTNLAASAISKTDVVWFYTQFMSGGMRYDARADQKSPYFTNDETQYGRFDQFNWTQAEHEKLLYAWLLQEFKVGRTRNPYGFRFFELQNICVAWEKVFLPIVTAVRDSYDIKGRTHYGRLANFVEERAPSGLAFPNPRTANRSLRVLSFSKDGARIDGSPRVSSVYSEPVREQVPLTNDEIKEVDAELRNITEKYGGVVERPKFKKNVKDWLVAQKERSKQKAEPRPESPIFGCQGLDDEEAASAAAQLTLAHNTASDESFGGERSPVPLVFPPPIVNDAGVKGKGKKKTLKLVPFGMYGEAEVDPDQPLKSPDHGVTRILDFPGEPPNASEDTTGQNSVATEDEQALAKPVLPYASSPLASKSTDELYETIRNRNPFIEEDKPASRDEPTPAKDDDVASLFSTMAPSSAIPEPLFNNRTHPVNENTIALTSLVGEQENGEINRRLEGLPAFHRGGFVGPSVESITEEVVSPTTGSPNLSICSPTHTSRSDDNDSLYEGPPPPIPPKNPRRESVRMSMASTTSNSSYPGSPTRSPLHKTSLAPSPTVHGGQAKAAPPSFSPSPTMHERIVSKENIRAHLALSTYGGGDSNDNGERGDNLPTKANSHPEGSSDVQENGDELKDKAHGNDNSAGVAHGKRPSRNFSHPFNTYNKHLFPRKDLGPGSPNVSEEYNFF